MEPKNLAKDCIEGLLYPWYVHYEEYLGAAEYLAGKMNLIKVFSPFTDEVVESCVEKHTFKDKRQSLIKEALFCLNKLVHKSIDFTIEFSRLMGIL